MYIVPRLDISAYCVSAAGNGMKTEGIYGLKANVFALMYVYCAFAYSSELSQNCPNKRVG